jgi:hypothetical protein
MSITQQRLSQTYVTWLSTYQWDWFITLTFREPTTRVKAIWTFDRWIECVNAAQGTHHFRWVRVLQFGAFGDNIHFHVLLGGLRTAEFIRWPVTLWSKMAGWAEPRRFKPDAKAFEYILRFLRPDSDPDMIDFFGISGN